jgi:hypothetical protein
MHRHLKETLTPPDELNPMISSGLAQVVEMMMAKDPSDRYHNAAELIEDLDLVADGQAPRHARSALDIASMVSSIARDTAETSSKPIVARTEANPANSGLTLAIIAGLVLSVLVNLILIAVLAGQAG